ncbi:MTH1187 family thiamine-binding protein [bacterium]|nr:MTH1187 family thiamine-binding protein [bacterium]
MKVMADICLIPIGVGVSLSKYIKIAYEIFKTANLNATLTPYGTIIEGEYDDVSKAIKAAIEAVHEAGAPRVSLTIKLGSRTDKEQTTEDKLNAVLN